MAGYKLNAYVHAVELDVNGVQTGRAQTFGPDDDLNTPDNAWALAAITNPNVWDGEQPPVRERPAATGGSDEVALLKARIAELEAQSTAEVETPEVKTPARSSSRSAAGKQAE